MRHINEAGIALIRVHEGLRLTAYPDPGSGGAPWTIGYGSTRGVTEGMTITAEVAIERLRADLAEAERCVESCGVELTDNEFAALVSLVFNIGCGAFRGSTLLRRMHAGDFEAAAEQFANWNRASGHVLAGLTTRRAAEAALFETA